MISYRIPLKYVIVFTSFIPIFLITHISSGQFNSIFCSFSKIWDVFNVFIKWSGISIDDLKQSFPKVVGLLNKKMDSDSVIGLGYITNIKEFIYFICLLTFELKLGELDPHTEKTGVQQRLWNLGYYKGLIDGIFGPVTKAAIQMFQTLHDGLMPDGIAGEVTQPVLAKPPVPKYPTGMTPEAAEEEIAILASKPQETSVMKLKLVDYKNRGVPNQEFIVKYSRAKTIKEKTDENGEIKIKEVTSQNIIIEFPQIPLIARIDGDNYIKRLDIPLNTEGTVELIKFKRQITISN